MRYTHWNLHSFLRRYATDRVYDSPRCSLGDKELSVLSEHEFNLASKFAARDKRRTSVLGRIYKNYRALDRNIRSLLNDADQILESGSQSVSAEVHTKAKSAVVEFKENASRFESDIKELLKAVSMDAGQALRRLNEISPRR